MSKFIENKIVNVAALEVELRSRLDGMTFDDANEARQFIDEIVVDLVERPAYDNSDLNFAEEGGDIYDILDNVDELRDLQNEMISELF